jgi:hypothetical protein
MFDSYEEVKGEDNKVYRKKGCEWKFDRAINCLKSTF